jgi:hypothetical protein
MRFMVGCPQWVILQLQLLHPEFREASAIAPKRLLVISYGYAVGVKRYKMKELQATCPLPPIPDTPLRLFPPAWHLAAV